MSITMDNRAGFTADQLAAITEGLDRMACPDSAEVIISADFVSDVRSILRSSTYGIARGTGVVGAKTIPVSADHQIVVVNADSAAQLNPGQLRRMLAHEAGHVLIAARSEELPSGDHTWIEDQVLTSLAAAALDEYRVEKALYAQGFELAHGVDWSAVGDLTEEVNLAIVSAVVDKSNSDDPEILAGDIAAVHDWSSKVLAYTVAAVASGALDDVLQVPPVHQADWDDYMDTTWPQRMAAYISAPDATTPMPTMEHQDLISRLVDVERHYLHALGFFYKRYPDTWGFFRRQDNQLFDARLRRAVDAAARRDA